MDDKPPFYWARIRGHVMTIGWSESLEPCSPIRRLHARRKREYICGVVGARPWKRTYLPAVPEGTLTNLDDRFPSATY